MTHNTRQSGRFKAIQNSSGHFPPFDLNSKQLDMFDKLDVALFSANMFAWEADFDTNQITHTRIENGSADSITFAEFCECAHRDDSEKLARLLFAQNHENRDAVDIEVRLRHSLTYRWYKIRGMLHVMPAGRVYASGVAYDIDQTKTQIEKLERLLSQDYLTGLNNLQTFDSFLKAVENTAVTQHAVLIASIDGLKDVNDSLGYFAGNQLIRNVAEVLSECFSEAEILARIAGGEYCAVFFGKDHIELEMKIKEADMMLHRMYLNLIKTQVSFAYVVSEERFDFTKRYREAAQRLEKTKSIKTILETKTVVDPINEIVAQKTGWGNRTVRLQSLCARVGSALGFGADMLQEVKVLAKIADIGLVGLDDRLAKNRLRLSGKDLSAYTRHTEYGRKLIRSSDQLTGLEDGYSDIYKRYDEWKDGISPVSRIVAAALYYDDITMQEEKTAFREIKKKMHSRRGTMYCPQVVDTILDIMEKYNE